MNWSVFIIPQAVHDPVTLQSSWYWALAAVAGTIGTLGVAWMKLRQEEARARAAKAVEESEKLRVMSQHLGESLAAMRAAVSAITSCAMVSSDKVAQLISCSEQSLLALSRLEPSFKALLSEHLGLDNGGVTVDDVYRELERLAGMLETCRQCQAMRPEERERIVKGLEKVVGREAMERLMVKVVRGKKNG